MNAVARRTDPIVPHDFLCSRGCSFTTIKPVCQKLIERLTASKNAMSDMVMPLTDCAVAYVKREGRANFRTQKVQEQLAAWEMQLRVCVQKQNELDILIYLVSNIGVQASAGQLEAGRNWNDWLLAEGAAYEQKPTFQDRRTQKEDKVKADYWEAVNVNHNTAHFLPCARGWIAAIPLDWNVCF
jgi:hypothetical protein